MLNWFENLSFIQFMIVLSIANVAMYVGSWLIVRQVQRVYAARNMNERQAIVTRRDLLLSLVIVVINIAVGVPGWWLWREGHIVLTEPAIWVTLLDGLIIFLVFDFAMYALHRLMHTGWLYRTFHGRHHDHVDVSGISFYVMNPAEALGFALILIGLLWVRPMSLHALLVFVFFNWAYGTMGHSGVPIRSRWLVWCVGDSAFHHRHHTQMRGNYGFYSSIWDRLFGTRLKTDGRGPDGG